MSQDLLSHPARWQLQAFAQGALAAAQWQEVEDRVACCGTCKQVVSETPDDRLITLLRQAGTTQLGQADASPSPVTVWPPELIGVKWTPLSRPKTVKQEWDFVMHFTSGKSTMAGDRGGG